MKNDSKVLIALFTGFGLGAITGVLIAPEDGSKTRNKLSKKGKKLLKKSKKSADDFVQKSSDLKDKVVKEGKKMFQ